MQSPRYDEVRLDRNQMRQNENMVASDVHVRSASSMFLDPLLSGGVSFQSKQLEARLYPQDPAHKQWETRVWEKASRDLFHSMWANGFAACVSVPHELYVCEPVVLELSDYEITVRTDHLGAREFEYRLPEATGGGSLLSRMMALPPGYRDSRPSQRDNGEQDEHDPALLQNVQTFEMNPPRRDGTLRSKVMAMYADYNLELQISNMARRAMDSRATPTLVLQMATPVVQSASVNSTVGQLGRTQPQPNSLLNPANNASAAPQLDSLGLPLDEFSEPKPIPDAKPAAADLLERSGPSSAQQASDGAEQRIIELDRDQILARQVQPEVPSEMIHLRLEREKRVYMLFGIPLNMVGDDRKRKSAIGSSGFQAGSQSEDIFMRAQHVARQQLATWLDAMHAHMHRDAEMYEFVAAQRDTTHNANSKAIGSASSSAKTNTNKRKPESDETRDGKQFKRLMHRLPPPPPDSDSHAHALRDSHPQTHKPNALANQAAYWRKFNAFRKHVTIGSQPDESEIDKLYAMGALSYSALVRNYAQRLGLEETDFNPSPVIPVTTNPSELPASTRNPPAPAKSKSSKK
jgi:hypothetical protein